MSRDFYARDTVEVAKKLLGLYLVHRLPEGETAGKIVETEAYIQGDPACHASGGITPRNTPMFGVPGKAYVYFIYGMHHCFNVVTVSEGVGEAVLVRALEPIRGIPLMKARRGGKSEAELCKGPGCLTQAMGITKDCNNLDLTQGDLFIAREEDNTSISIVTTTRIGINKGADLPLRFYIKGSPYISKK